jgi:hypothetical protein
MKKGNVIRYTFEDRHEAITAINIAELLDLDKIKSSDIIGSVFLPIENEIINVPLIRQYNIPYTYDGENELGTIHYIYYEKH